MVLNWDYLLRLFVLALLGIVVVGVVMGLIVLTLYKMLDIDKIEHRLDALEEFQAQIEKEKGNWRFK